MNKEDRRFLLVMAIFGVVYVSILCWPLIFPPNVLSPRRDYWLDALEVAAHVVSLVYLYRLIKINVGGDKKQKEKLQNRCMYYAIAGLGLRIISVLN